ncbi:MAG: NADH-quinone oxidoreductase subunit K [Candidatus Altiarchaeota archaeon]|nr:NADH-quinone oxidoreductase subunit K [Candidatus Altiarchaeota archaeon]
MTMIILSYTSSVIIFCIGLYTIMARRNLFKTVIGLALMEAAVLLLIVTSGYIPEGVPPIIPFNGLSVNPLPHAFTLTAIVIGASDIALALAFIIKLHRHYRTVDLDRIRGLRG